MMLDNGYYLKLLDDNAESFMMLVIQMLKRQEEYSGIMIGLTGNSM